MFVVIAAEAETPLHSLCVAVPDLSAYVSNPAFRSFWPMSDRAVARVVQARVAAAGYDPWLFAGHSLRAGFITSGARAGASIFKLKKVSRHKSTYVLAGYIRDAQIFEGHAGEAFL